MVTREITANIEQILKLSVDVNASTITCNLRKPRPGATCVIVYGPFPNCTMYSSSSTDSQESALRIELPELPKTSVEFCYTVQLLHDSPLLSIINGSFRSACNPNNLGEFPSSLNGAGSANVFSGVVYYTGLIPGSVAMLICNPGYRPVSSINRTCRSDGHWSEERLSCVVVDHSASSICRGDCITAVAVTVCVVFLALVILCVTIALCLCRFRDKGQVKDSSDDSGNVQPQAVTHEKKPTTLGGEVTTGSTIKMKETPKPVDTYADPEDLLQNPPLPPRRYEGAEEVKISVSKEEANTGDFVHYESIQEVRSSEPVTSLTPSGQHELYSQVFDALPKGKSTKIAKKPTI